MENKKLYRAFEAEVNGSANGLRALTSVKNQLEKTEPNGVTKLPKVLMYHRIVTDRKLSDNDPNCLHVDEFRRHLELLDMLNYTPITFRDYRLSNQGILQLPQKPVILTFDDGYLDTFENGFPLLTEFGMKAVMFVLGDPSIHYNRWDANKTEISDAKLMRREHIVELNRNDFEIGSHTFSHKDLTELPPRRSFYEIKEPKLVLEDMIGTRVNSFSYPYGLVDQKVKLQVIKAGYKFACGVFSGPPTFCEDPMEIRRIEVPHNVSFLGFATRLVAPYGFLEWLWWKGKSEYFTTTRSADFE